MEGLQKTWGDYRDNLATANQVAFSFSTTSLMIMALSIVMIAPLWLTWHFPNQNGLLYMLTIHVLKEFNNPVYGFAQYHDKFFLIVPNLTFHTVVYLLSFILPLTVAYKLVVTLNMLFVPITLFYFIKSIKPQNLLYGFIGYVFSYNYFLLKGYDTFILSFSLFLVYFAIFYKWLKAPEIKYQILLILLSTLMYLSHIYAFLISFVLSILFIVIKRYSLKKITNVLLFFLPGFLLFGRYLNYVYSQPVESFGGNPYKFFKLHWIFTDFLQMDMLSYSMTYVYLFWIGYSFVFVKFLKEMLSSK